MITIGIDTGGTCTDAVVYDTKAHQVLSYGKTLTTKEDLKEGILKALKALAPEAVKKAACISLSTTLATNACVEGKGGRAKLVMIGIGAPSGIFVGDVAALLHGEADVPAYAMVANAIGAAVGSVNCEYVVRIEPCAAESAEGDFVVTGGPAPQYFQSYAEAVTAAKALAEERACQKAREQGARGVLRTEVKVIEDHYDLEGNGNRMFLEASVVARTAEL